MAERGGVTSKLSAVLSVARADCQAAETMRLFAKRTTKSSTVGLNASRQFDATLRIAGFVARVQPHPPQSTGSVGQPARVRHRQVQLEQSIGWQLPAREQGRRIAGASRPREWQYVHSLTTQIHGPDSGVSGFDGNRPTFLVEVRLRRGSSRTSSRQTRGWLPAPCFQAQQTPALRRGIPRTASVIR